jgi:hypothetical protein
LGDTSVEKAAREMEILNIQSTFLCILQHSIFTGPINSAPEPAIRNKEALFPTDA